MCTHYASDVAQDGKIRVLILGRGARLKSKIYILFYKLSILESFSIRSLCVCGVKWEQREVETLSSLVNRNCSWIQFLQQASARAHLGLCKRR